MIYMGVGFLPGHAQVYRFSRRYGKVRGMSGIAGHGRTIVLMALILAGAGPAPLRVDAEEQRGAFEVVVLNAGQGDAILLHTPGGRWSMIDAGPSARKGVLPYLKSREIQSLQALILTHPHGDHYGGMVDVMDLVKVETFYDPGVPHPTGGYMRVLEKVKKKGVRYVAPKEGDKLNLDPELQVTVVHPDQPTYSNLNNNSLVLHIRHRNVGFLFTGDAEKKAEARIAERWDDKLRVDVLKVGHHGSRSSSNPVFLAAVKPAAALISCGLRNSFGHPHPETLEKLKSRDVRVWRTDKDGYLTVRSDGEKYRVDATVLPFPEITSGADALKTIPFNAPGWTRQEPVPERPSSRVEQGQLHLTAHPGEDLWKYQANAPKWLRKLPAGTDWTIGVTVEAEEAEDAEAGIGLYLDPNNFLLLGRSERNTLSMSWFQNGSPLYKTESVYTPARRLLILKSGDRIDCAAYDPQSRTFKRIWRLPLKGARLNSAGLTACLYAKSWGLGTIKAVFEDYLER